MSYVDVYIHAVWGTKRREPILAESSIPAVCDHILANAKEKGFYILEVNAVEDHVHCLMALKADWSVARQMQMIKGESAFWINKRGLLKCRLEWADEYYAGSVSKSKLDVVKAYIRNQREHHRKVSFKEEYEAFLEKSASGQG